MPLPLVLIIVITDELLQDGILGDFQYVEVSVMEIFDCGNIWKGQPL